MTAVLQEPRLTRAELDAWATFGREWDPFKKAWLERGLHLPPMGDAEDDDERPSQRSMLWQVLDAWPTRIAEWVAEAPPGSSAAKVVAHVMRRWHEVRDSVASDEAYDDFKRVRRASDDVAARNAWVSIRELMAGKQ